MPMQQGEVLKIFRRRWSSASSRCISSPRWTLPGGSLWGRRRWCAGSAPGRACCSPSAFVPCLESRGLITQLDFYVWEEVCRFMQAWRADPQMPALQSVSVNVSRCDIRGENFCARLAAILSAMGCRPGPLHLEVTESACAQEGPSF